MRQENIIILLYKGGSEIQILNGCLHRKAKLEFQQRRCIQVNSILAAIGSNRNKDNLMWTGNWEPKSSFSSHWNLLLLPCQGFMCWTHVCAHFAATCYLAWVMMGRSLLSMNHNSIFPSFSVTGTEFQRKLGHHSAQSHNPTSIPLLGQSCMEQAELCITQASVGLCAVHHTGPHDLRCVTSQSHHYLTEKAHELIALY